ncbi:hypothetical protein NX029_01680 [Cytobacillus firmus]|nr:hypothetical protein [Cytobacillus firmus]
MDCWMTAPFSEKDMPINLLNNSWYEILPYKSIEGFNYFERGKDHMGNIHNTFGLNKFKTMKETSKAVEFRNIVNGEVIYLLPNKEITIVLNPKKVEGNKELEEKSTGLSHSTALREFPKREHTGNGPICYGYAYKFLSVEELDVFLDELTKL